MTLREQLIKDAGAFCEAKEISKPRLGTIIMNNGKFFQLLEAGGDCTTKVYERFQAVFNDPKAWDAARLTDKKRRAAARNKTSAAARNKTSAAARNKTSAAARTKSSKTVRKIKRAAQ